MRASGAALLHPLLRTAALATLVMLTLSGCVEGLFFHPDNRVWSTPRELGVEAQDVFIAGPEGSRLHGWWLPAKRADNNNSAPARGTVLHVHGNAANISNHLPLVAWLPASGWNVLMFDYRGFGKSSGKPSLDGVVADTRAALDWLRQRPGVGSDSAASRIVVLGQSLGGATALRVVAADDAQPRVRGLIVDSAFASYRGIARDAVGPLAVVAAPLIATLPGEAADPLAAARRTNVAMLVIHGGADGVIPLAHGEALYAAVSGARKQWLRVEGGQHLDALMRKEVRLRVTDWLERVD